MSNRHTLLQLCTTGGLVVAMSIGINAEAGLLGFGGDSWKEEVLLHDGQKLIAERSQSYEGQHEIWQPPPIKEHTITFTLTGSDRRITWTSEYGKDIGRTNFHLLALHLWDGTPYIVAEPNLCLSYNKWGRPNPPYVFFKYDGTAWQRIPLEAFPSEFTTINVALSIIGREVAELVRQGVVSSEKIKEFNRHTVNPDHKTILREPVKQGAEGSAVNCEEMIHYKCGWISPHGTFGRDFMDQTCK